MADQPLPTNEAVSTAKVEPTKKAIARAKRAAQKAEAKAERATQRAKAKEHKDKVKSLAKLAEAKILKDISSSLDIHARSATFACGGSVAFKSTVDEVDAPVASSSEPGEKTADEAHAAEAIVSPQPELSVVDNVQVRFGQSGKGVAVIFDQDGALTKELEQLLSACQPASFGRGGEAVLDEEYRKAGKLDRSQFATSFCPYEAGIVDVVTQLLVPQYKHDKHVRSIKAELYKLNVYSAPNGKFKPHVDTPRSKDQISSLVVSLPSAHEGGQLTVSNAGAANQKMVFDWSTANEDEDDPAGIKWAAFYSDCQHEVHQVTSGHRVTLTYNLFLTRGVGHLAGISPALDSTQLPLYRVLEAALDNPGFLRRGRVLAMYLTHAYAHTNKHVNFLPESLKGADMSLWNTAQALGLTCTVVPVIQAPFGRRDDRPAHVFGPRFRRFNEEPSGGFDLSECNGWGTEMPEGKMTWLNDTSAAESKARKTTAMMTMMRARTL